jgi:hypothetical protein
MVATVYSGPGIKVLFFSLHIHTWSFWRLVWLWLFWLVLENSWDDVLAVLQPERLSSGTSHLSLPFLCCSLWKSHITFPQQSPLCTSSSAGSFTMHTCCLATLRTFPLPSLPAVLKKVPVSLFIALWLAHSISCLPPNWKAEQFSKMCHSIFPPYSLSCHFWNSVVFIGYPLLSEEQSSQLHT